MASSERKKRLRISGHNSNSTSQGSDFDADVLNLGNTRRHQTVHACYFCHKIVPNPRNHCYDRHHNEIEAYKLLAPEMNAPARHDAFALLIRKGDFYHNMRVLSNHEGMLIVERSDNDESTYETNPENYLPCPYCLVFLEKTSCSEHYIICPARPADHYYLLNDSAKISWAILFAALNHRHKDKFRNGFKAFTLITDDELILKFGSYLLFTKEYNEESVKRQLKHLVRLHRILKGISCMKIPLHRFLEADGFNMLEDAIRTLTGIQENKTKRDSGTYARNLEHMLKVCAIVLKGEAIRNENANDLRNVNDLIRIINCQWVGCNNALLPLAEDLIRYDTYIRRMIVVREDELNKVRCPAIWQEMARLVLSRLGLYNKRKSGIAKLLLTVFEAMMKNDVNDPPAVKKSFTLFEQELAKKRRILEVNVTGRGRGAPLLIPSDLLQPMTTLYTVRKELKFQENNPYFFCNPTGNENSAQRVVRALNCCIPDDGSIKNPDLVGSQDLRTYAGTVCQLLDMSESEYLWLRNYLGHSKGVGGSYSSILTSAKELAMFSATLIAIDEERMPSRMFSLGSSRITVTPLSNEERGNTPFQDGSSSYVLDLPFNERPSAGSSWMTSEEMDLSGPSQPTDPVNDRYPSQYEQCTISRYFDTFIDNGIVPPEGDITSFLLSHPQLDLTWKRVTEFIWEKIMK